jgi:hypothetical protein
MALILDCMGGLGNQLFQYAGGLAVSAHSKVYISKPRNNGHSGKDYREMFFGRLPKYVTEYPPNNIPSVGPPDAFVPWNPADIKVDQLSRLHAYFQYLPAIESVIPVIVQDVNTYLSSLQDTMRDKYKITELYNTAFLHVRRGDYLTTPHGLHWLQDEAYYTAALKRFPDTLRWLVVSDDPAWCRAQPWLSRYEIVDEPDEIAGLALQSLCRGGAIIANSTYSWWGAMLGSHTAGARVVYPSKWFKNDIVELFPATWVRI